MGINGRIGLARNMARIKQNLIAEAKAAGIDITDRKALQDFRHNSVLKLKEQILNDIERNQS